MGTEPPTHKAIQPIVHYVPDLIFITCSQIFYSDIAFSAGKLYFYFDVRVRTIGPGNCRVTSGKKVRVYPDGRDCNNDNTALIVVGFHSVCRSIDLLSEFQNDVF